MTARSTNGNRLLIVGWDGADWEIIDDLISRGCLPFVSSMIETGARGVLNSTIPSHSWSAWSTFMTGVNPGRHGIFDFVERDPTEPRRRIPVSSGSIKATTFLEDLSEAGREIRVGNVPVTFPPIPVRGRLIGGVAIPPHAPFVHPPDWAPELQRRAAFPINGMEWTRFENDPQALVSETQDFIERRTRSFEVLLEGDWDVATCVYLAPDRLQHPFGTYLLPSHPDHQTVADSPLAKSIRDVYKRLDEQLSRLVKVAGEGATVVLLSDHGFRPINRTWNLGALLETLGFAASPRMAAAKNKMLRSSVIAEIAKRRFGHSLKKRLRAPSMLDWANTTAYQSALGFGVSANLKGREPDGIVDPKDREKILDDVTHALLEFTSEGTNDHPVGGVTRREELYEGPYADLAPDLIVGSNRLWAFERMTQPTGWSDWPSGTHRLPGILVASGGRTTPGDLGVRNIVDIAPTVLSFCGLHRSGFDGQPIQEISGGVSEMPVAHVAMDDRPRRADLSREEEEAIGAHLRSLGYIE